MGDVVWRYEPDEDPKWRHHWGEPRPGFVKVGQAVVGKCPSGMSVQDAEELLNAGVEYYPRGWNDEYPKRIFVVHEGTVYRATPTIPGVSYHGFPEMIERLPPDPDLRQRILDKADSAECIEEVAKWMRSKRTTV